VAQQVDVELELGADRREVDHRVVQLLERGAGAEQPEPRADARDVRVDRHVGQPEREQQHAGRRLTPHAGQRGQICLRLRAGLVGRAANDSPVWRRATSNGAAGAYLISDTGRPGVVRHGGVAQLLGLQSIATIPLLSSTGVLGIVTAGDTHAPRIWREHDRELLEQIALQGTVVVDNARLRELERHEARNDALTGLANRRAFTDELEGALDRARATDPVTGLRIAVDLGDDPDDLTDDPRSESA